MASRGSRLGRAVAAVAVAAAALGLAASVALAQAPDVPAPGAKDPLEGLNRGLYAVHRGIDKVLLRPVARIYLAIVPKFLRQGIHNALANLGEPITVVNDLLQGEVGKAATATTRFAANSTFGILGLFDVATPGGLPYHTADFGQTLGKYGVHPGPYVFVPVLGPSSLRDLTGRIVDQVADPVRQVHFHNDDDFRTGRIVMGAVDTRAIVDKDLEELDRTATDPYVTLRSAYLQNRQSLVRGGQVDVQSLPSFGPEPGPVSEPVETEAPRMTVADTFFRSMP